MEFNEYNESVKNWTNGILDNYRKDAELTIRYCHEMPIRDNIPFYERKEWP